MSPTWFPLIILAMTLHLVYIQFFVTTYVTNFTPEERGSKGREMDKNVNESPIGTAYDGVH